jgi:ATP-dependent protease ClpP protease subunit
MLGVAKLQAIRGPAKYPLYLVLDSPGGSIQDGAMLIEFMKTVPNVKTITVFAASMAAGIVEAVQGERLILSSGIIMFHRASGGFQGQFDDGEVESQLRLAKSMVAAMEKANYERMGLSKDAYKQLVKDEYWLFGALAVVQKAVDKVVTVRCTNALINSRVGVQVENIFGSDNLEFSGCPLLQSPLPEIKKGKK